VEERKIEEQFTSLCACSNLIVTMHSCTNTHIHWDISDW